MKTLNLAMMLALTGMASPIEQMWPTPRMPSLPDNWRDTQTPEAREEALRLAAEKRTRKAARFYKPNALLGAFFMFTKWIFL